MRESPLNEADPWFAKFDCFFGFLLKILAGVAFLSVLFVLMFAAGYFCGGLK